MMIETCIWCGQPFPEPIDTDKIEDSIRVFIPLLRSLDDWIDAISDQPIPEEYETIVVECLVIDLVIDKIHVWVHSTCRDACMAAVGVWFRLLKDWDVMPVKRTTWEDLVERHQNYLMYEVPGDE